MSPSRSSVSNSIAYRIHCQIFRRRVMQLFQNIMKRNLAVLRKNNRKQTNKKTGLGIRRPGYNFLI